MRTKYSRLLHGLLFASLGAASGIMAVATQITNAVNAHYFPKDADEIHAWPVWAWSLVAVLCVVEAIAEAVWKRFRNGRQ